MPETELPYRQNVGAVLFNKDGRVFIGRRADAAAGGPGAWQLPQGGIDADETPQTAVLRELAEEVGTDRAEILAEHPDWHSYDLPPEIAAQAFGGQFRGQRQRWFALRFLGADSDIRLDAHSPAEFCEWRWAALADVPSLAVGFKRAIYEVLAKDFAKHAIPKE